MIEWTKFQTPDCLIQDPNLLYVVPCDDGSKILFQGEECLVEDKTVQEIVDKFNSIGCTSFLLTKEEIEVVLEQFEKENEE